MTKRQLCILRVPFLNGQNWAWWNKTQRLFMFKFWIWPVWMDLWRNTMKSCHITKFAFYFIFSCHFFSFSPHMQCFFLFLFLSQFNRRSSTLFLLHSSITKKLFVLLFFCCNFSWFSFFHFCLFLFFSFIIFFCICFCLFCLAWFRIANELTN